MADHDTTIRMKTIGMADAATEVDQLSRVHEASMRRMENASAALNKADAQAAKDGLVNTEAQIRARRRLREEREKDIRHMERAGRTDPDRKFSNIEEDIVRNAVSAQERWKDDPKMMEALSRSTNAALLNNDRAAAAEGIKIAEKEAEAKASFNAWLVKEEFKSNNERLKATAEYNAEIAKENEAAMEAELDRGAKFQRAEAEQLAEASKTVEKFESEMARNRMRDFQERVKAGQGGSGRGGLNGFGGKMILGMAAGRTAGDILGDQHGGREIGSAISGFMFGGPVVGAAVTGLDLISEAFIANRENAKAAEKATKDYSESLNKLSDSWSGLASKFIKDDPVRSDMQGIAKSTDAMADKAQETLDAQGDGSSRSVIFGGFNKYLAESMGQVIGQMGTHPIASRGSVERMGYMQDDDSTFAGKSASKSEREANTKIEVAALGSKTEAIAFEAAEAPKIAEWRKKISESEEAVAKAHVVVAGSLTKEQRLNAEILLTKQENLLSTRKLSAEMVVQEDIADEAVKKALSLRQTEGLSIKEKLDADAKFTEALKNRNELLEQWGKSFHDKTLSEDADLSERRLKLIVEEEKADIDSVEKVAEHIGSRLGKAIEDINKKNADMIHRFTEEGWTAQEKIAELAELANEPASDASHTRALFEERKLQREGMGKDEAESLAKKTEEAAKAVEHLSAVREMEKEVSEAQYEVETKLAKTQKEREKAKHDFEVREGTAAGHSKEDAEKMATAKDIIDDMKPDDKPFRGQATDRYTRGNIDFTAFDLNRGIGSSQGKGAEAKLETLIGLLKELVRNKPS